MLPILMMRPDFCGFMMFSASRQQRKAPVRLVSITFCQRLSGISSVGMPSVMPALLTRMSSRACRSTAALNRATTSASTVMSVGTASTAPPSCAISPATASSAARSRAAITTLAPSMAKARAMALPMPLLAPVTMATRSCSCFIARRSSRWRPGRDQDVRPNCSAQLRDDGRPLPASYRTAKPAVGKPHDRSAPPRTETPSCSGRRQGDHAGGIRLGSLPQARASIHHVVDGLRHIGRMIAHAFEVLRAKQEVNAGRDDRGLIHHVGEKLPEQTCAQPVAILVPPPDVQRLQGVVVREAVEDVAALGLDKDGQLIDAGQPPASNVRFVDGTDAFADVLRQISNPLELVCKSQNTDDLPQVVGHRLAPRDGLDGPFLDHTLHHVHRRVD